MLSIFNGLIYGLGLCSSAVIVGGIIFVLYVALGNRRKPSAGQRQEQVDPEPPQQTDALAISELDRQRSERILREALG